MTTNAGREQLPPILDGCRCLVTINGGMAYLWSSVGCPLHDDDLADDTRDMT